MTREPTHWIGSVIIGFCLVVVGVAVLFGGVTSMYFITDDKAQPRASGYASTLDSIELEYSELSPEGKDDFNKMLSGKGVDEPAFSKKDKVVTKITKDGEDYFIQSRLTVGDQQYDSLEVKVGLVLTIVGLFIMVYSGHKYSLSQCRRKIERLESATIDDSN